VAYFSRVPSGYAGEHFAFALGGDYRGDGGTRPPNILVGGDAKVNVPH